MRRARTPVAERAVVRSDAPGLLETIRCVARAAPLLARHQERLVASWSAWFRGTPPDLAEVTGAAIAAAAPSSLVRVAFLHRASGGAPRVEVSSRPLPPAPARWRVALAASPRVEPAEVRRHKQLDRGWVAALTVPGVEETLVWDDEQGLLEGTRSNLFVWRGDELSTPPLRAGLVPGVVRAELMGCAPDLQLLVVERLLTPADLLSCDALVLTGSGVGVVVVDECDGRPIGSAAGRAAAARLHSVLFPGG